MIAFSGIANMWQSPAELEARREEGRELARKHFADVRDQEVKRCWENRCVNLSQTLSDAYWRMMKRMDRRTFMGVTEYMIGLGARLDAAPDELVQKPAEA